MTRPVLERLDRVYLALFREYPALARLAVVTGAGQTAFALLNVYALPVYLIQDLHVSGLAVGAVSATFLLCETALKFPLGRLSDRFGRKPFVVLGPLLICLNPIIIIWLPPRLWGLVFPLRALDGAGAAALWPPLYASVGDLVHQRSRAAAMSVLNTVYVSAIGLAAAAGAVVAHLAGSNHAPFYVAACLLAVSAATAYLGLPSREIKGAHADAAGAPSGMIPALPSETAPAPEPTVAIPLTLVLLISFLMTLGVLMLTNFVVVYMQVDLRLSGLQAGMLFVGLAIPVVLLGLPLGHAADRWGRPLAVRISFGASALVMWVIPCCRTIPTFAVAGVVLVIAHILGTPAWLALVSQLAPKSRRGGVMGMVATAQGIGAALGPLLAGWLWDIEHSYIFYGSAAILTIGALIAAFTVRREHPREAG